ncbi:MAG: TIGR02391 family protein [Planctomycetota bacterium]|nr:TIGR02391 family protein [Planctomycetota bacterium]
MSYQDIAVEMDGLMGAESGVECVDAAARELFRFRREMHPNSNIKYGRAQLIYDWILTLAKQRMSPDDKAALIVEFCRRIARGKNLRKVDRILAANGVEPKFLRKGRGGAEAFDAREINEELARHCRAAYLRGDYFQAVSDAAAVYARYVKSRARGRKEGEALMVEAWDWEKGALRVAPTSPATDKSLQSAVLSLSVGLMRAFGGNPAGPGTPTVPWPISDRDCLDILCLISFLMDRAEEASALGIS